MTYSKYGLGELKYLHFSPGFPELFCPYICEYVMTAVGDLGASDLGFSSCSACSWLGDFKKFSQPGQFLVK